MKILFFGDSITDMGRFREFDGHFMSYGAGFVRQIASELFFEEPDRYEIINRGIGGNEIVDLYARLKTDVWDQKPDVLSILVGINDIWHQFDPKPRGTDIRRYEKIYRAMIEETKERLPQTQIIVCEPFVLRGESIDDFFEEFNALTHEYAKVVKKIAKGYSLPFVSLQEKFDEMENEYGAKTLLYDGVHPNLVGANVIAKEWLKIFKECKENWSIR